MNDSRLRIGLLVNPRAGLGGPAGLRGSDGEAALEALSRGAVPTAPERALRCLRALSPSAAAHIAWVTWGGDMGADILARAGFPADVAGHPAGVSSTAQDTRDAARRLLAHGIDLLLFAGGDGTARDVCAAIGSRVPALGIPAGVKMYSGVFAVSPEAAAAIVDRLLAGEPVSLQEAEVRDIDETAFRSDRVLSRHYGELQVPGVSGFVQHVKCGSPEDETVLQAEIAAGIVEQMEPDVLYLSGTGGTVAAVSERLVVPGSRLGIDALYGGKLAGRDLDAAALRQLLAQHRRVHLLLGVTGGQGFLLGRGNQQLAADIVRDVLAREGRAGLQVLATRAKLDALGGRPLLVDTGDRELDAALAGLHPVVTGYRQQVLYRIAAA
ncbi:MAG: ATP-NAD kinase family protein [Pseudomonadota bacterium]